MFTDGTEGEGDPGSQTGSRTEALGDGLGKLWLLTSFESCQFKAQMSARHLCRWEGIDRHVRVPCQGTSPGMLSY